MRLVRRTPMGAVGPTSASPTPAPAPTTPAAPAVNVQQITTEIGAIVGLLGVGAYYSGKVAGEGGFEKAPWWTRSWRLGASWARWAWAFTSR